MIQVYCYNRCSTCKKALKWLDEHGLEHEVIDIKENNPTTEQIKDYYEKSGLPLKRFFNTSGQIYRSMELSKKLKDMSEEEQIALLATDGMLVKRPLLISGDTVFTGFKEAEWETLL